ncbi:hypothetical protein VTO42DRAFT_6495 [Malbranchea cinnamomea]
MELKPRSGPRIKLSCQRCRQKKIRCDKGDPECGKCKAAGSACTYAQRRQRPRKTEHDDVVSRLSRRLEFLESQFGSVPERVLTPRRSRESTVASTTPRGAAPGEDSSADRSPDAHRKESSDNVSGGFYQMANEARNTTIEKLYGQGLLIPTNDSPSVSSAIEDLNGALAVLGSLKLRPEAEQAPGTADSHSPDEARQYIEDALRLIKSAMIGIPIDMKLMKALPDVINSSHVHLDPAVKLIYYNLLLWGRSMGSEQSADAAQHNYIRCLQLVPEWYASSRGTLTDLMAAVSTALTAVNCFDYHLAWKFHCEACRLAKKLGLDRSELLQLRASEEGLAKDGIQELLWGILQVDLFFAMIYDKPRAIKVSLQNVDFPNIMSPTVSPPAAGPTIVFIVWTRILFIATEYLDYLETHDEERLQKSELFKQQVNAFCDKIENVLIDWPLMSLMKMSDHKSLNKWLYADTIIGANIFIIVMQRKMLGDQTLVSEQSLRSGRTVIDTLIHVSGVDSGKISFQPLQLNLLTFYPFCAFFVLYYHILSCSRPEDCAEDIRALEKVGLVLEYTKSIKSEFVPISNAVNALNRISKIIQENRITLSAGKAHSESSFPQATLPEQPEPGPISMHQQNNICELNLTIGADVPQSNFLDPTTDLSVIFGEEIQPMWYMRAIENEFVGRNWHESWWDIG